MTPFVTSFHVRHSGGMSESSCIRIGGISVCRGRDHNAAPAGPSGRTVHDALTLYLAAASSRRVFRRNLCEPACVDVNRDSQGN